MADTYRLGPAIGDAPTSGDYRLGPALDTPQEQPPSTDGLAARFAKSWAHDTLDIGGEGIKSVLEAPSKILDPGQDTSHDQLKSDMEKKFLEAGHSPSMAKFEAERLAKKMAVGEGAMNLAWGPMQAITSPIMGLFRTAVSRPIEEATGFPKEATEAFTQIGLGTLAITPMSRAKVSPGGEVAVEKIGTLPTIEDFKVASDRLSAGTAQQPDELQAKLLDKWEQQGIHPAEVVHDSQRDGFIKHELSIPEADKTDHSGIQPPGSSPFVKGTPRTQVAKTGEEHIDNLLDHPPLKTVIDNPIVDDTHTIPNSWGGSVPLDNPVTYRDREFPKTMTVDGVTFDTAEPAAIHENIEEYVIMKLMDAGVPREEALRSAYWGWGQPAEHAWYVAHGMDPEHVEAAYKPILDYIAGRKAHGDIPDNLFKETYPGGDPRKDAPGEIEKPSAAELARAKKIISDHLEKETVPRAIGADITRDVPDITKEPPAKPGRIVDNARYAMDQLLGIARNTQYFLDPMATGSNRAMAIAKDAISFTRRIDWDRDRQIDHAGKNFKPEALKRMWDALDEESVLRQEGKTSENMGLATLDPAERAAVEEMRAHSQAAWQHAVDVGLVEGDGLPAYSPRIVMNIAGAGSDLSPRALNELGRNVFTRVSQMRHRKYLMAEETEAAAKALVSKKVLERGGTPEEAAAAAEKVAILRDIRALPIATARLEKAAVWKEMINKIEEAGKATGSDTVRDYNPGKGWFTIAGNPAFQKWAPALEKNPVTGKWAARTDDAGNTLFVPKQIYMPNEFRGPMRAILDESDSGVLERGASSLYGALMAIKGRSMQLIMNSPLIHNAVVWSKAAEAAGGREYAGFGLYFRGNKIVNENTARADQLIERGLAPMGHRGSFQDITSITEDPNLTPGRSWTAKVLSFVPGLFDPKAEVAVKRSIDKAGDFWHNTLLWDRVRDLQFGLADHLSDHLVGKGVDRVTADRIAANFSNIVVGSLPKEMMSQGAQATANMLLFSRSFTLGNLAVYKQAVAGLPKPILAQIERDFGMSAEEVVGKEGLSDTTKLAKGIARRKAIATLALSAGVYYVGNALLQNAFNMMLRDTTLSDEIKGYARRFLDLMSDVKKNPFELRHMLARLSPTSDNEPEKSDRVHIGYDKDGTAIYARNPVGKYGEEMVGWPTHPGKMLRQKLSPLAGGALDSWMNDQGFGKKVYDEHDNGLTIAWAVAKHIVAKNFPEGQISALSDMLHGEGDQKLNAMRVFGPALGFTASVGAPGGMARGEQLSAKNAFDARFNLAWPEIKKMIKAGDLDGANRAFDDLRVPPGMRKGLIRNATNPAGALRGNTLRNFYQYATPEEIQRFERDR